MKEKGKFKSINSPITLKEFDVVQHIKDFCELGSNPALQDRISWKVYENSHECLLGYFEVQYNFELARAICLGEKLVGTITMKINHLKKPYIGYVINPDFQGLGIGTKALQLFVKELNKRGYENAYLVVAKDNEPSLKVAKRSGFKIYRDDLDLDNYYGKNREAYGLRINLKEVK